MTIFLVLILYQLAVSKSEEKEILMEKTRKPKDIQNWPNMAHLEIKCLRDETLEANTYGSASIINQQILLTTARLLDSCKDLDPMITAVVGHQYVNALQKYIPVHSHMIHENYRKGNPDNDIALLKLEIPMELSKHIQKAALVRQASAKIAVMLGWVANTRIIIETELKLMSRLKCMKRLKRALPKGTYCGLLSAGEKPMSNHDHGGPLLIDNYIQIGITSEIVGQVVVYTDVSYHYDWIVTASKDLICSFAAGKIVRSEQWEIMSGGAIKIE